MEVKENLVQLFENWSGEKVKTFSPLPASGSQRKYFRIAGENKIAIGALNLDRRENQAFIYLSKHFLKYKLNVPKVYAADLQNNVYLHEYLGEQTLFSLIEKTRKGNVLSDEVITIYKKAIERLPFFQITASKKIDYSYCYPRAKFDRQSMLWDLNYFKYFFLKLANIPFDEEKLEKDFNALAQFLLQADCNYFMYRDFNSRNIMIVNNEPYFIDYQGGRKGALQYDIASLLYDSKANLPLNLREEFLDLYISSARKIKSFDRREFLKYYHGYLLIRLLQMFGAYGYRGYFEGKAHFLRSISFAVKNLEWLLKNHRPKIKMPELFNVLGLIAHSAELKKFEWKEISDEKLTVRINSFSYREKIPIDITGNGGGFVFDCRAISNPGRYDEYKSLNGIDKQVQEFLDEQPEAQKFLTDTFDLIDNTVENYIERKWTDLMVNYGCTGGQHRSVYCAERLARHLKVKYDINVILTHTKY